MQGETFLPCFYSYAYCDGHRVITQTILLLLRQIHSYSIGGCDTVTVADIPMVPPFEWSDPPFGQLETQGNGKSACSYIHLVKLASLHVKLPAI